MPPIRLLSPQTINRIAAGEVIERPMIDPAYWKQLCRAFRDMV